MYVVFPPVDTAIFELCIVLMDCWSHAVSKRSSCLIISLASALERVVGVQLQHTLFSPDLLCSVALLSTSSAVVYLRKHFHFNSLLRMDAKILPPQ